jgi:hypothetical protein
VTVTFRFKIDQKVKVEKLDMEGFITVCAVDNYGHCYFVKTVNGGDWYHEKYLIGMEA